MIKVDIRLGYAISSLIGKGFEYLDIQKEFEENSTIETMFNVLASDLGPLFIEKVYDPEKREFKQGLTIFVNRVFLEKAQMLNTLLKDGDNIFIMPLYLGG